MIVRRRRGVRFAGGHRIRLIPIKSMISLATALPATFTEAPSAAEQI